jgi:putative tryptophan/tyrosine transport system substrate-binding protein
VRRRLLLAATSALPSIAWAQGTGVRRVAVLIALSESDPEGQMRLGGLREGLRDLGWIEGKNLAIDARYTGGSPERTHELAQAFAAASPDVIVVNGTPALGEIHKATRTIPVVFMAAVDPVGLGYIDSLARPGGNITGFGSFDVALVGKWLQLLKEVAPSLSHATVAHNPANTPYYPRLIKPMDRLPGLADVPVTLMAWQNPADIARVIAETAQRPGGGLLVPPDGFNTRHRAEIASGALAAGLPLIATYPAFVRSGALMSYSTDTNYYRQAAGYVDRILKGARPADLPVQLPTRFQLVINMATARKLGLTVPPTLLAQANEVIE